MSNFSRSLAVLALAFPLAAQTRLTGAGATFPAPIYQKWFAAYQSAGNVQINYQPIGSGGGIKAVTEGTVDFGASDAPLTDAQLAAYKAKNKYDVLLFPTVQSYSDGSDVNWIQQSFSGQPEPDHPTPQLKLNSTSNNKNNKSSSTTSTTKTLAIVDAILAVIALAIGGIAFINVRRWR